MVLSICWRAKAFQEPADTCVGVGDESASFAPLLFPLHHDVAVGYGLGVAPQLFVVLEGLRGGAVFHIFFYVIWGLVDQEEVDHEMGVCVVLVVDDVVM